MAKANKKNEIYQVPILNYFRKNFVKSGDLKDEEKDAKNQNIFDKLHDNIISTRLLRKYKYIKLFSFRKEKLDNDEEQIIFKIDECIDDREILFPRTGLFIGKLFFENGYTIDINNKYNDMFLKHMIAYASNIYFDDTYFGNSDNKKTTADFNFFEYYFLLNFKKLVPKGLPVLLSKKKESDVSIRGKIDFKRYISYDIFYNYKFTYYKNDVVYDQNIIDVLYKALLTIKKDIKKQFDPSILQYEQVLKELSSNSKNIDNIIKKAIKSKALNNYMYREYKTLIRFAEFIIKNQNICDNNNGNEQVSGYLIDMSELWEIYITKLLKKRFNGEYTISSQEELKLYEGTFYRRSNMPDIVIRDQLEKTVAVLDAKFKTMSFDEDDVDRPDLFQINHYTFYYYLKENHNIKFASLVYPTEANEEVKNELINMYGLNSIDKPKFKILALKIPTENDNFINEMQGNEEAFLDEIGKILDKTR